MFPIYVNFFHFSSKLIYLIWSFFYQVNWVQFTWHTLSRDIINFQNKLLPRFIVRNKVYLNELPRMGTKSKNLRSYLSNIDGLPFRLFQRSLLIYCKLFIRIFGYCWFSVPIFYPLNKTSNLLWKVELSSIETWDSSSACLSCHFLVNSEPFTT